ncbi:hypothetical protein FNYG_11499 [Fusarium nygamai]|uniref:Uncharacterized protein n=1 Tax=Gibberella nygamai TaxID=42673 RepID=A0A2K0VYR7_GIBNY|nr:hypothetical protein FNYG_11499 [Fusarium nygamai]
MFTIRRRQTMGQVIAGDWPEDLGLREPEPGQERRIAYELPDLDEEAIFRCLTLHECYEPYPGYSIKDLPKFGGFDSYGVDEYAELELCKNEVKRLVSVATSSDVVTLKGLDDLFGHSATDGYLKLHFLGLRLLQALLICAHDVALILVKHTVSRDDCLECAEIQAQLLRYFNPVSGKHRYWGDANIDNDRQKAACCEMFDYLTAIFVKMILRNFRGDYWVNNLIAIVAKITAKVKFLLLNLPNSHTQTIKNSKKTMGGTGGYWDGVLQFEPDNSRYDLLGEGIRVESARPLTGEAVKYFFDMKHLYQFTNDILTKTLSNLAIVNPLATQADDFESSIALYDSLITNEQVLLSQERDGSIGAANEKSIARTITAGFRVCMETWNVIDAEHTNPENAQPNHYWMSIAWKCSFQSQKQKSQQGEVKLSSMVSIIMASTPYSMISGPSATALAELVDFMFHHTGRASTSPSRLIDNPRMVCKAVLQTGTIAGHPNQDARKSDSCPVSGINSLQRRTSISDVSSSENEADNSNAKSKNLLANPERSKEFMDDLRKRFDDWAISDSTIVVPYKRYAWSWIAFSIFLVFAGLVIGLSIGDRIKGVDPFNISMFCWALAGVVLLVAKAIRVENWPWSDFLTGLVPCRSVSEVSAVTGIDSQLILAYLLGMDCRTYLQVSGPYNGLFSRPVEEGGFSIDVPVRCATAMEGGFIPIKILGEFGPGIIFIYTHSWTCYNTARPVSMHKGLHSSFDMAWNPVRLDDEKLSGYRLKTGVPVVVRSVLGVFDEDCCFC